MAAVYQSSQQKIAATLAQLRRCTQINIQSQWYRQDSQFDQGNLAELNSQGHIAWPRGKQTIWLTQTIQVPVSLQAYLLTGLSLRLRLRWWAEQAEIYLQNQRIQTGDLFDCTTRILLSPAVTPGLCFDVAICLVSPQHDEGALVESYCLYEWDQNPGLDPGFFADEIEVIFIQIQSDQRLVDQLAATLNQIDWSSLSNQEQFERSLSQVRHQLLQSACYFPTVKIRLLGHAHLDLAWLWPVTETWEAAQRTFESVLTLQQDFPELIFTHSSPALFAWLEEHRPDLFQVIFDKVEEKSWEIAAGLWVEPELNIINGESIVRQILYGQNYVKTKFGYISEVAWLPDTFGFCWQLPQFLNLGGIRYFVTQKLRWNDTTEFPHEVFYWEGLDGTQILSLMSAEIGQEIDPIKMANYATNWQDKTRLQTALWLPGVGDHGGGPTRDMLEMAQRWQQSPFFPSMEFMTATDYLRWVEQTAEELPVWQDELYLEFHRGCYTTHADQKYWNRCCEGLLYQAELFAAIATLLTDRPYPKAELETAWKQVLFNQFHDILPGSSIPEVYVDANQTWQAAAETAETMIQTSLNAIATALPLPASPVAGAQPILVFNPLNWQRSAVVSISSATEVTSGQVYDAQGLEVPVQQDQTGLQFLAEAVPGIGYRLFWWVNQLDATQYFSTSISDFSEPVNSNQNEPKTYCLENEFLQVIIDGKTGEIARLFDKQNQRNVLQPSGGNQLQFFQDQGQYWDAWNIDPNYQNYPLPAATLTAIDWIKQGELEWRLRVKRTWGKSEFNQDYVLQQGSAVFKIETTVNWREHHVLVKAAFPLTVTADFATCEIPCGVINRTTKPQTPSEQAKWEIPALNWVNLGDETYGVSLLNNCKYGYDLQPDQIRLTLLRGSTWPDPKADCGIHQFSYGIYPHSGSWKTAKVVQQGYEFNQPLRVTQSLAFYPTQINPDALGKADFFQLQSNHLILMGLKQAEQNPNHWILRCYECHGEPETFRFQNRLGLTLQHPVNLLEQPLEFSEQIQPWQIISFQLTKTFSIRSCPLN